MAFVEIAGQYVEGKIPVGTKIKFEREKQRYTVRASNRFFSICTKPLNMITRLGRGKYKHEKTVIYTIVDWTEKRRGPENLVFGFGAETDEQCQEMLQRLTDGDSEVSERRDVPLDVESFKMPSMRKRKHG